MRRILIQNISIFHSAIFHFFKTENLLGISFNATKFYMGIFVSVHDLNISAQEFLESCKNVIVAFFMNNIYD